MRRIFVALFVGMLLVSPVLAGEMEGHGDKAACPMHGHDVVEKTAVKLTGKVLCMHCNLHQEDSCRKVFQPTGEEALFDICPESDMEAIENMSEHGSATLVVSGQLMKAEDGKAALVIEKVEKSPES